MFFMNNEIMHEYDKFRALISKNRPKNPYYLFIKVSS